MADPVQFLDDWPDDLLIPASAVKSHVNRIQHTLIQMDKFHQVMAPVLVLFREGEQLAQIVFRRFDDDESKQASFHTGFAAISALDADAVLFFADSWMRMENVALSPEEYLTQVVNQPTYVRPSEDPNRTEALTVVYFDHHLAHCYSQYPYGRSGETQTKIVWQEHSPHYGTVAREQFAPGDLTSGLVPHELLVAFTGNSTYTQEFEKAVNTTGMDRPTINQAFLAFLTSTGYVVSQ